MRIVRAKVRANMEETRHSKYDMKGTHMSAQKLWKNAQGYHRSKPDVVIKLEKWAHAPIPDPKDNSSS